jgi:hypothetical protein
MMQAGAGSYLVFKALLDAEVHRLRELVQQFLQQFSFASGQRARDEASGANGLHA